MSDEMADVERSHSGDHAVVKMPVDLPGALDKRTRAMLSDVRIVMAFAAASVVAVFGGGWAAYAQVRDVAHEVGADAARTATAGVQALDTRVSAVEVRVKEQGEDVRDLKDEVRGLRKDLRRLFPALPALPADGGGQ